MIQEAIVHFVGFIVLFLVLKKLVWRPVLATLDERRARIEDDLRRASETKAQMERLQEDLNRRLNQIEQEARARLQQAIEEGKRISAEVQDQAREQAQAILAKSKDTVEIELAKARVVLRDQVADMAVGAVERILQQKLDAQSDRRLVEQVVTDLEQGRPKAAA